MKKLRLSTMQFIERFGNPEQKKEAQQKSFKTDSGTRLLEVCMEIVENNNLGDVEVYIPSNEYHGIRLIE
jgi:hypothetical protein